MWGYMERSVLWERRRRHPRGLDAMIADIRSVGNGLCEAARVVNYGGDATIVIKTH